MKARSLRFFSHLYYRFPKDSRLWHQFLLTSDIPATAKPHMTILKRASYVCPEGQNIDIRGAEVTIIRKLGIKKTLRAATTGKEGVCFVDAQIEPGQNSQQTRLKDIYPNGRYRDLPRLAC